MGRLGPEDYYTTRVVSFPIYPADTSPISFVLMLS